MKKIQGKLLNKERKTRKHNFGNVQCECLSSQYVFIIKRHSFESKLIFGHQWDKFNTTWSKT